MSLRSLFQRFFPSRVDEIPGSTTADLPEPRIGRVQCASPRGLHRMAYREWGDPANGNVVVCVHGLTRNSHDFDFLAAALAKDFRVICPDVAGRGDSDWLTDKMLYGVPQYLADMVTLIARLDVERVDWVGTSLGGLIGMTLASLEHSPIRRMVLNDVGPLLAASALQRIATYVGRSFRFTDLTAAETHLRLAYAPFGPLSDGQWQFLTRHSVRRMDDGYEFNYDPGIGDVFRSSPVLADVNMWPIYDRIRCPTLVVRGADSDLLSRDTLLQMSERGPRALTLEFPGIGHAPTLMEQEQIDPIRDFLSGT